MTDCIHKFVHCKFWFDDDANLFGQVICVDCDKEMSPIVKSKDGVSLIAPMPNNAVEVDEQNSITIYRSYNG